MKIIYSCINVSFLNDYLEALQNLGFKEYQVFEQVLTMTMKGTPRMNTSVWPGYSSVVIIQCFQDNMLKSYFNFVESWNNEKTMEDEKISFFVFETSYFSW